MRQWTIAEREHQSALIKKIKPWEKSTGPCTEAGKEKSNMNAYKDGYYTLEGKEEQELVKRIRKKLDYCTKSQKKNLNLALF